MKVPPDRQARMDKRELIGLGEEELTAMGLLDGHRVLGGKVYRTPKAYPVYDDAYYACSSAFFRRF